MPLVRTVAPVKERSRLRVPWLCRRLLSAAESLIASRKRLSFDVTPFQAPCRPSRQLPPLPIRTSSSSLKTPPSPPPPPRPPPPPHLSPPFLIRNPPRSPPIPLISFVRPPLLPAMIRDFGSSNSYRNSRCSSRSNSNSSSSSIKIPGILVIIHGTTRLARPRCPTRPRN